MGDGVRFGGHGVRRAERLSAALTPGQRVRLARENLGLAMALFAASHRGLITAAYMPARAELYRPAGQVAEVYVPLGISDHESLVRGAGNQLRGAFALAALQTQRELAAAYGGDPLAEPEGRLRAARAAIYLIAGSVGENLIAPHWNIAPEYREVFTVPDLGFTLDATDLHGQEVRWEHIGGLPGYLDLTLFVSHCLDGAAATAAVQAQAGDYGAMGELAGRRSGEAWSGSPVVARVGYGSGSGRRRREGGGAGGEAEGGWMAPDGPPQPRFSVAGQARELGPVDEFIAGACGTGERAMALAGELYTAYAQWCLEQGYLAYSQRKFGLELRRGGMSGSGGARVGTGGWGWRRGGGDGGTGV